MTDVAILVSVSPLRKENPLRRARTGQADGLYLRLLLFTAHPTHSFLATTDQNLPSPPRPLPPLLLRPILATWRRLRPPQPL